MKIKELECIKRLAQKEHYYEICNWLIDNNLLYNEEIKHLHRDLEKAEFIYKRLKKLEAEGNFLLLHFEWQILPFEFIKLTCVTSTEEKLFTYGL